MGPFIVLSAVLALLGAGWLMSRREGERSASGSDSEPDDLFDGDDPGAGSASGADDGAVGGDSGGGSDGGSSGD